MFKDKINVTTLKAYNSQLSELKEDEAIQVLHRGSDVKVIITQDRFFELIGVYNRAIGLEAKPVKPSSKEERAERFLSSMKVYESEE